MTSVLAVTHRRSQLAVDAGLAGGLIALSQLQVWTVEGLEGDRLAIAVVSLAVGLSLLFRRRHPLPVVVVVCAYFPITAVAGWNTPEVTFFPSAMLMLASYSVAAHGDRRRAGVGAALVLAVGVAAVATGDLEPQEAFFFLLFNAAAWTGGLLVHSREQEAAELAGRSEALEREADERARIAAAEERARIARELHDVVSHGLSGIVLEAAGAERVLHHDPEAVRGALDSIQRAGRQTAAELRRLLGIMRAPHGTGDAAPLPSLTGADQLIERARRTGLAVELRKEGDLEALPAGLQVAAYRILQEAVTNVLKHAPGATADVVVRRSPDALEVEVLNDGPRRIGERARPGHGLIGMRERVALYGGELEAGARRGGGFRVHARFPLTGPAHEDRAAPRA